MNDNPIILNYEIMGEGLPIIFLHGYPLNRTIWSPLAENLAAFARVILVDLRGHGNSPAPEGKYSMELMAADIINLMDSLNIKKAILVGHSMGGYASLAFVKNYPDRLGGLGLVATQATADSPEKRQARLDSIQQVKSDGVAPIADGMLTRLTSRSDLYAVLRNIMVATPRQGVIGTLQGIADREDATSRLKNIRVPTLILAGIEDKIISLDRAEEMARLIPNAWLVKIPGAGHMPMMETPDSVVKSLMELIHTVEAKRTVK